jgi:hypothetical protein
MAPRINDRLSHGTACNGRTHHENHEFIDIRGPVPSIASGHGRILHSGALDSMVYGIHARGTPHGGCIRELTTTGG